MNLRRPVITDKNMVRFRYKGLDIKNRRLDSSATTPSGRQPNPKFGSSGEIYVKSRFGSTQSARMREFRSFNEVWE